MAKTKFPRGLVILLLSLILLFILGVGSLYAYFFRVFDAISFEEWEQSTEYTPYILHPLPEKTCLKMGPTVDSEGGRILLMYSDPDYWDAPYITYQLFESNQPIIVGEDILPHHSLEKEGVISEKATLLVNGQMVSAEIITSHNYMQYKVATFEFDGTHFAFSWQNIDDESAYHVLANNFTPLDRALITQQNSCPEEGK